jgi:hypothetical protein
MRLPLFTERDLSSGSSRFPAIRSKFEDAYNLLAEHVSLDYITGESALKPLKVGLTKAILKKRAKNIALANAGTLDDYVLYWTPDVFQ